MTLKKLLEEATPAPWEWRDSDELWTRCSTGRYKYGTVVLRLKTTLDGDKEIDCSEEDRALIVYLVNHAAAFAELVEAGKEIDGLLQPGGGRFGLVEAHRRLRAALRRAEGR